MVEETFFPKISIFLSSNFTLQKSFVILLQLMKIKPELNLYLKRRKQNGSTCTSHFKSEENKRRTHYKVTAPSVNFDETTGDYSRSHRVSLKGYYKGRKIAKAASAE